MITTNYSAENSTYLQPLQFFPASVPEPYETELRTRLYDIMEDWEDYAENLTHPALQKEIRAMIDQIDNAMHPAEEED